MEYMVRFTQVHETFRLAEIEALAVLENVNLKILSYSPSVSPVLEVGADQAHFFSHLFASSNSRMKMLLED
jgi:tRNA G10  N-methylase Trm11